MGEGVHEQLEQASQDTAAVAVATTSMLSHCHLVRVPFAWPPAG